MTSWVKRLPVRPRRPPSSSRPPAQPSGPKAGFSACAEQTSAFNTAHSRRNRHCQCRQSPARRRTAWLPPKIQRSAPNDLRGRQRSQGGAKFPTGGICWLKSQQEPASACGAVPRKGLQGQQIWCETRADGHSPDERDRETHSTRTGWLGPRRLPACLVARSHGAGPAPPCAGAVFARALILV